MSARAAVQPAARAAALPAACALLCALAPAQVRQMDPLELAASRQAHQRTVMGERALHFFERFSAASEEARRAARIELEKARTPGSAVTAPVSLTALIRAARALVPAPAGEAQAEAERLQRFMDELDVRAVPGVFEAREGETRPQPVTLQVQRMMPSSGGAPEWISAWWIAPDGSEQRARRESLEAALAEKPFELYVHAPKGPPGTWQLVLQGERGEVTARGLPIRVEGVRDWSARLQSVLARDDLVDGWAFLAAALTRLQVTGARSALTPPPGEMLAALEQRDVPRGTSHPLAAVFVDGADAEHWLWTLVPDSVTAEPAMAVLLLAPLAEAPELLLAGEPGRRWLALAQAQRAVLFAAHLPAAAAEATDPLAPLTKVRALHPGAKLLVVARGDTWGRLALALKDKERARPDALVIPTPLAAAAPRELDVPWLLVAPGGAEAPGGSAREHVAGNEIPLLDELLLPERVAAWLRAREGPGGK